MEEDVKVPGRKPRQMMAVPVLHTPGLASPQFTECPYDLVMLPVEKPVVVFFSGGRLTFWYIDPLPEKEERMKLVKNWEEGNCRVAILQVVQRGPSEVVIDVFDTKLVVVPRVDLHNYQALVFHLLHNR